MSAGILSVGVHVAADDFIRAHFTDGELYVTVSVSDHTSITLTNAESNDMSGLWKIHAELGRVLAEAEAAS